MSATKASSPATGSSNSSVASQPQRAASDVRHNQDSNIPAGAGSSHPESNLRTDAARPPQAERRGDTESQRPEEAEGPWSSSTPNTPTAQDLHTAPSSDAEQGGDVDDFISVEPAAGTIEIPVLASGVPLEGAAGVIGANYNVPTEHLAENPSKGDLTRSMRVGSSSSPTNYSTLSFDDLDSIKHSTRHTLGLSRDKGTGARGKVDHTDHAYRALSADSDERDHADDQSHGDDAPPIQNGPSAEYGEAGGSINHGRSNHFPMNDHAQSGSGANPESASDSDRPSENAVHDDDEPDTEPGNDAPADHATDNDEPPDPDDPSDDNSTIDDAPTDAAADNPSDQADDESDPETGIADETMEEEASPSDDDHSDEDGTDDDDADDGATFISSSDNVAGLEISIVTRASGSDQKAILTIVDADAPDHAYAKFLTLDKAGVSIGLDAEHGLDLSDDATYLVSLEHAGGGTIKVADLVVDGLDLVAGGIEKLDGVKNKNPSAFSAILDLGDEDSILQAALESLDGGARGDRIHDSMAGSYNVLAGLGGKDVLTGSSDSDLLIGGDGKDRLQGGDGDDVLVFNGGDAKIDGGAGTDILRIDDGARLLSQHPGLDEVTVNLSAHKLDGKIHGIETILITDESNSSADRGTKLELSLGDVLDMTGKDHDPLLTILGNAGDSVDLGGQGWVQQGDAGGFHVFTNDLGNGGLATVRIDVDIQIADVAVT